MSDQRMLSLIEDTVASHLMSEVPLGIFLSGGLDSSVLAALAARHSPRLPSFTVRFTGHNDDADVEAAAFLAGHLGFDHHELHVEPAPENVLEEVTLHHDDPVGDAACVPTFLMAKAARPYVTVVLTGEGGDEAFGGYEKYRHLRRLSRLRTPAGRVGVGLVTAAVRSRRTAKLKAWVESPHALAALRYDEVFTEHERSELFADGEGGIDEPMPPHNLSPLNQALWTDSGWPLSEQLCMKVDKMTMAASVEARVPYLDHVLFEAATGLPDRDKRDKAIVRRGAKGLLPPAVLGRRKHGFTVPVSDWLRQDLRALVDDLLSAERIRADGLWNPSTVSRWTSEHLTARTDRGRQLWNLLAVQLWRRSIE